MSKENKENYLDDPKKNKKENLQTEKLLYNGETIEEKNEKKREYKEKKLNE